MHLKSIGPFERMSCNERPMARGAAGGDRGSAPRASDPRADTEGPGKPANVRTLRHQVRSIDWTLVQYGASEADVSRHDLGRGEERDRRRPTPTHVKERERERAGPLVRRCNAALKLLSSEPRPKARSPDAAGQLPRDFRFLPPDNP